jgi:putative ABC transport system permease protein
MAWTDVRETLRRFRSLLGRNAVEDGLSEEIRFHLEQQTEKNIRAGMDPVEARRRAFVRFGGVEHMKELTRDEFRPAFFDDFMGDLRYGIRVLRRAPGFACVAAMTLGLGIGAATAVFTVVNHVLLTPLPYVEPDRIVRLFQISNSGLRMNAVSEPNFLDWKQGTRAFRAMAQLSTAPTPVGFGRETLMITGSSVSREFFDVMGVQPVVGRTFVAGELAVGGAPAAIISDRLWRSRFGAAPLESLQLRANDSTYQVAGVMPSEFDYPPGTDFWFPRELSPPQNSRTGHNWVVVARLADNVQLRAAVAELSALSRGLKQQYGEATWMKDATALPLREQLTAGVRPALMLLFAASVVLLLIACLNVSNLLLARAATRRRELALRLAIGAGRGRLIRQLLAEALVLSAAAAAIGTFVAFAGVRALVMLQPANLPRVEQASVDVTALTFAMGAALVTALGLGLATAWRVSKLPLRDALIEGARSVAGGRATERIRHTLVVVQVALTIVLLVGAGLLARSFAKVMAVDPGFATSGSVLVDTEWTFTDDAAARQRHRAAQEELLARLHRLPGVDAVGLISSHPLGSTWYPNGLFTEMSRPDEIQTPADLQRVGPEIRARQALAGYRIASEGYFAAMGIRLMQGRLFEEGDGPDAPHVALVSESLAATKWPGQDPIGRFIQFGNMDGDLRGLRIVGVVSDVREGSPETAPGPLLYGYYKQRVVSRFTLVVRSAAAAGLTSAIRQAMNDVDPDLPVQLRTLEESLDRAVAGRRFSLTLIAVFSGTALVLAALGIYGLISYLVAERTREIGIRLALGAEANDVLRLVITRGASLAVSGIGVGLVAALGLTRVLDGMLFGVTATDPVALGSVMLLTLAAVLAASYSPARKALRVAPMIAMRAD